MFIIFNLFIGFLIIYYIIFFITLIYISIIEEWCCPNRIPYWYNRLHDKYQGNRGYNVVLNNPYDDSV